MNKKAASGSIIFLIIMPIAIAVLIVAYYALSDPKLKIGALALAVLLALIALAIIYDYFGSAHNRLRRKLASIPSITQGESIEIRERIERKLKADKKMELLIQNIGKGSLEDQKSNYQEMFELYKRLPEPV